MEPLHFNFSLIKVFLKSLYNDYILCLCVEYWVSVELWVGICPKMTRTKRTWVVQYKKTPSFLLFLLPLSFLPLSNCSTNGISTFVFRARWLAPQVKKNKKNSKLLLWQQSWNDCSIWLAPKRGVCALLTSSEHGKTVPFAMHEKGVRKSDVTCDWRSAAILTLAENNLPTFCLYFRQSSYLRLYLDLFWCKCVSISLDFPGLQSPPFGAVEWSNPPEVKGGVLKWSPLFLLGPDGVDSRAGFYSLFCLSTKNIPNMLEQGNMLDGWSLVLWQILITHLILEQVFRLESSNWHSC